MRSRALRDIPVARKVGHLTPQEPLLAVTLRYLLGTPEARSSPQYFANLATQGNDEAPVSLALGVTQLVLKALLVI